MFKKNNQAENLYTFLARKFYEEKNNESVHAGMRLVYRIIKAYNGNATHEAIAHDVAKVVPMWMLAQGKISVDGCIKWLEKDGYIEKRDNYFVIKTSANGAVATAN